MVAGFRVQRLVDTALDAAGAVPRGMTVTKQREACGQTFSSKAYEISCLLFPPGACPTVRETEAF